MSKRSMQGFVCNLLPSHVVFGSGTLAHVAAEASRLELTRVLVVTTPGRSEWAHSGARILAERYAATFAGAAMHTPVDVTEQAMRVVAEHRIDGVLAIGGGSTIGLSKAIALRTDLPQIVVPTTYAGSEVTSIIGETKLGVKETQKSSRVLPEVVIYDVELTLGLSPQISAVSGMNAIAHAVEALYAQDTNPLLRLVALEAVRAFASALPRIADSPRDPAARADALYGAWLCGLCLGTVGMALHHKLCHVLGGSLGLPHAETHAVVLPYATEYNARAAEEPMRQLADALGNEDAAAGLYALARRVGAPRGLKDLGMSRESIDRATEIAMAKPYWNPRPLEREAIRDLIARAYEGAPLGGER